MKKWLIIGGAVVVMAVIIVALSVRGRHDERGTHGVEPPTMTVTLGKASLTSVPVDVEATGTVRPVREADVAPKIMSAVEDVLVVEGDHVTAGQVIVRLDSDDLRAEADRAAAGLRSAQAALSQAKVALELQETQSNVEVQQAEAALEAARANLAKVKVGPRPQQREQLAQNVDAAKAGLDAAQQKLSLAREGARRQQKAQAAEAVTQAEAAFRTAEADLKRIRSLKEQGAASQQQLDHAQLQYDSAKAQLEQARQQQDMVQEGSRTQELRAAEAMVQQAESNYKAAQQALAMADEGGRHEDVSAAEARVRQAEEGLRMAKASVARNKLRAEDVKNAEAAVARARAGLNAAKVMLAYATIRAPIPGLVTARHADPGDMASPGTPLLRIEDDSLYRLEAIVPERDVGGIHLGQRVKVSLDALDESLTGAVALIVPSADPASRTFIAKINLPSEANVESGMFGRVSFGRGEQQVVLAPKEAVIERQGLKSVFVLDGERKARLRLITQGRAFADAVEVLSGLAGGEQVVLSPPSTLQDGSPVAAQGGGAS